jgi:acyl carrier protein
MDFHMNNSRMVKCFEQALGIPAAQVTDSLAYSSIKEWDSVAHMALVAALESEFDIMLDTDDILAMSSVAVARQILQKNGVVFE